MSSSAIRLVAIGLGAGLLAGVFGVGGGILIVPALVAVLAMERRVAHATSLAAVVPIASAGLVPYLARGDVDWVAAAWLTTGALAGTLIGTAMLARLSRRALAVSFVALLAVAAVRLVLPLEASDRGPTTVVIAVLLVVVGLLSGTVAGLLGVGGGIVIVPVLVVALGVPPVVAKATSLAVVVPTALLGTWRNRRSALVELRTAGLVGLGGVAAALAGGWLAGLMSPAASNVLFGVLLAAVAIRTLREATRSD
jgi:uncharacterized membrane protein YfcA